MREKILTMVRVLYFKHLVKNFALAKKLVLLKFFSFVFFTTNIEILEKIFKTVKKCGEALREIIS